MMILPHQSHSSKPLRLRIFHPYVKPIPPLIIYLQTPVSQHRPRQTRRAALRLQRNFVPFIGVHGASRLISPQNHQLAEFFALNVPLNRTENCPLAKSKQLVYNL